MILDDGTGVATLPVPPETAVSLKTSLQDLFTSIDVPSILTIKPGWKAYGWTVQPVINSMNFNFETNKWIWTKDTLPTPRV
jgi:hypothetical protein